MNEAEFLAKDEADQDALIALARDWKPPATYGTPEYDPDPQYDEWTTPEGSVLLGDGETFVNGDWNGFGEMVRGIQGECHCFAAGALTRIVEQMACGEMKGFDLNNVNLGAAVTFLKAKGVIKE